jgi:hypothetical protein
VILLDPSDLTRQSCAQVGAGDGLQLGVGGIVTYAFLAKPVVTLLLSEPDSPV